MIENADRSLITRCCYAFVVLFALCGATTTTHHHKHQVKHTTHTVKQAHKSAKSAAPADLMTVVPSNLSTQDGIDRIINQFSSKFNVGVLVQSTDGTMIYQHNANQGLVPGSTMKLFTAAAALSYLGPDYVFRTQFLAQTTPQSGVLPGNLYVKFSGDPTLTVQDLTSLVRTLASAGVRQVRGALIIDDTAIDRVNMAPGMKPEMQMLCYAAPTGCIILNRNCFGFSVAPGRQNGAPRISYGQGLGVISVINQASTRRGGDPLSVRTAAGGNTFLVSGCVSPRRAPLGLAVTLNDTRKAGTAVLINLFRQEGISVANGIGYGPAPDAVRVLAEHDSPTLRELVTHMLKKSDNLYANTLFKKLGSVYFHTTGSWENGAQAVRAILGAKSGIDFTGMVMQDGCGLSRYDRISPTQFAALLNYVYHYMPNNTVFYQALPRSGIDGTLRNRMGGATLDKIHAKTGTLDNVSGLAGYIKTVNNQTLIFGILVNAPNGNQGSYHMLEDRICRYLALR